jgi:hypothetical protein
MFLCVLTFIIVHYKYHYNYYYHYGVLGVVTRLIQPLPPSHQPHLPVAYPVSTDEALTPESQRDNCYISAEGNAGTHRICPEALKVPTLPLDYHSLG